MHLSPVEFIFSLKWGRKKKKGGGWNTGVALCKMNACPFSSLVFCWQPGSWSWKSQGVDSALETYGRALGNGWLVKPLHRCSDFQSLVISAGMVWGVSAPMCQRVVHERRQLCPSPAVANGRPLIKAPNAFSSSSLRTPPQSPLKYWVLVAALGRSVLTHQVVDKPQITELKKLVQKQT